MFYLFLIRNSLISFLDGISILATSVSFTTFQQRCNIACYPYDYAESMQFVASLLEIHQMNTKIFDLNIFISNIYQEETLHNCDMLQYYYFNQFTIFPSWNCSSHREFDTSPPQSLILKVWLSNSCHVVNKYF